VRHRRTVVQASMDISSLIQAAANAAAANTIRQLSVTRGVPPPAPSPLAGLLGTSTPTAPTASVAGVPGVQVSAAAAGILQAAGVSVPTASSAAAAAPGASPLASLLGLSPTPASAANPLASLIGGTSPAAGSSTIAGLLGSTSLTAGPSSLAGLVGGGAFPSLAPGAVGSPAAATLTGLLGTVAASQQSAGIVPHAAAAGASAGVANQLASMLGAAGAAAATSIGGAPLVQSPLITSALAEAQAAQEAQQKQAAETLQRLQNIQSLQNLLAENERKKNALKQQTQALHHKVAVSTAASAAGLDAGATTAGGTETGSPEAVTEQAPIIEPVKDKPKSPEECRAAAVAAARAEAKKKIIAVKEQILSKTEQAERLKCHLHKKPKDNCKFCKKHREFLTENNLDGDNNLKKSAAHYFNIRDDGFGFDSGMNGPIEVANKKTYGFPSVVQSHILDARYFETTLMLIQGFDDLIDEATNYVKSVEPYMPDSTTMPSPFFCIVYRLFTLGLDGRQVRKLIDRTDSPYVRCMGFVYLRFGLHTDKLWGWFGDYVMDDEDFQPTGSGSWTTIGDFVESLLIKEKYYTTLLPRVSGGVRRQLEERLAPVAQCRKRQKANRDILDIYDQKGTKAEVCINGLWHDAVTQFVHFHPSRPKVHVKLTNGDDEAVELGKVILSDDLSSRRKTTSSSNSTRGRSRSRSPRDRTDWTRCKGKSDAELVEELRAGQRERAVCTSGKDYGRRPSTFDKGLAQPREGQGVAARRLLEEETFVKMSDRARREDSPQPREMSKPKEPSLEHQERMRKLFEKYGNAKGARDQNANNLNSIEGPDVMRLG